MAGLLISPFGLHAFGQVSPESDRVVIAVAGDVLPESSWAGPQDVRHIFDGVREIFSSVNLVFLNLEEPVTRAETRTKNKNPNAVALGRDFVLRARDPSIPQIFKASGVGLVALANNHMMDYSAAGLSDTLQGFQDAGLPVVGAGLKPQAVRPFVLEEHGLRVAFLAFSDAVPTNYEATPIRPGVASSQDEAELTRAIREARRQAEFVILMIHWGGQGSHLITRRQRHVAQVAVAAGCDAVVGMHPHVLQGIEFVGRAPVFYSIGNFAFPSKNPAARECVLVKLFLRPGGLELVELVPIGISPEGAPRVASGEEAPRILNHLDNFCRMFNAQIGKGKLLRARAREPLRYGSAATTGGRSANFSDERGTKNCEKHLAIGVPHAYNCRFVRAGVAQLAEHLICNQRVGGSNPFASSSLSEAGRTTAPADFAGPKFGGRAFPGFFALSHRGGLVSPRPF